MRQEQAASVMVVSTTDKAVEFFQKILPKEQFSPLTCVHSAGEAQRMLVDRSVDIVVINAPLKDEMGTELAIELAQNQSCGVMMMVKNDVYEQVSYKVEEYGVLTLPRPCTDIDIVCVGSGIDLAVNVAHRINRHKEVNVFKNFGTAMFHYQYEGEDWQIEFVGARKESYRANSRKPIVENGTK